MEEQLGIIKDPGFGCRDVGRPVLFFAVYTSEYSVSLQVLEGKKAMDFITAYGVYDVKKLDGKPVWVTIDGNHVEIVRAWEK